MTAISVRRACLAIVAATLVETTLAQVRAVQSEPEELIAGPSAWVPFTYTLETRANGQIEASYTVYRAADGSTRRELDGGGLIEITNRTTGRYYRYERGLWFEHPARPHSRDGKPFLKLARSAVAEIAPDDVRVAGLMGASVTCSFVQMLAGADKSMTIFCPELNLLPVYSRLAHEGHVTERVCTSLVVGEPQATFLPPPGVLVTQRVTVAP